MVTPPTVAEAPVDVPPPLGHLRALDGLRGAAVLAVLLFHSGLLAGGYLGVDLFFVLSGFLITSLLLTEVQRTGRLTLSAFWARRARRLLPALLLVLGATAVYAAFLAGPDELQQLRSDALATLGYVANWRCVLGHFDYWSLFRRPSPLEHTWSLAIEEQFYVLWPLLVLAVVAARRTAATTGAALARRVCWASALLAVAGAGWSLWLWASTHDGMRIYYGTDTRAPALLAGAAFAGWQRWRGPARAGRGRTVLQVAGAVGAGILIVAWSALADDRLYGGGLIVAALAGVAVVAAAAHPHPTLVGRALSIRPLVTLGVISYGVYLWHWPIDVVLDAPRTGLSGWPLFVFRFAVTLAVATASFLLVERPIRRGAVSGARLRVVVPPLVAGLLAVTVVSTAGADDLVPDHTEPPDPQQLARAAHLAGSTRVMVGGNSVAYTLATDGLAALAPRDRLTVLNDGLPSCDFPPTPLVRDRDTLDVEHPIDCTAPWRAAVAAFDPKVVLLFFGDVHVVEYRFGTHWISPCDRAYPPHYRDALDRAVRTLRARGARVVLTTAAYSFFIEPGAFANIRRPTRCTNALIRRYARHHPDVTLVDVNRLLCPDGRNCGSQIDGHQLRRDGVHYEGEGARRLARWVLAKAGLVGRGPRPVVH